MYVIVIGLRGVPGIQGGIETHAENLYPHLVSLGCKIEIIARSFIYKDNSIKTWKGVNIHRIWAPKTPALEAFIHTFLATLYAAIKKPDLLHIHAVGPMLMTPLARLLGLKVVVTHHGQDYDREKWGKFTKVILRIGEKLGAKYSNEMIVISNVIKEIVKNKYDKDTTLIQNGVNVHKIPVSKRYIQELGLDYTNYILQVSRFVPEKRQLDLIQAFNFARIRSCKLVLVGDISSPNNYVEDIKKIVSKNENIVLTGFQSGTNLQELYANANLFVLPSSHEGMPIAILEALSYGLKVLASDITANLEIGLPSEQYFTLGDVNKLSALIKKSMQLERNDKDKENLRILVKQKYDWKVIAARTMQVYEKIIRI